MGDRGEFPGYGPQVDIWSAGCIFYELLCGERIFDGEDDARILDEVVTRELNWHVLFSEEAWRPISEQAALQRDPKSQDPMLHDVEGRLAALRLY